MRDETAFQRLERAATALFGSEWMSPLAAATGRDDRTIRRWKSGTTPLPHDHEVFDQIAALIDRKIEELGVARFQLTRI